MAATTAVVAGTAGAVQHHQQQKYANQAAEQQAGADQAAMEQQLAMQQAQIDAMSAQQAPPPAIAAPAPAGKTMDQKMAELTQLGQLRDAGILNESEFNAQKAAILAS
jgi:hypothetical protein